VEIPSLVNLGMDHGSSLQRIPSGWYGEVVATVIWVQNITEMPLQLRIWPQIALGTLPQTLKLDLRVGFMVGREKKC